MSGLEALRVLWRTDSHRRVVLLTTFDEESVPREALGVGSRASCSGM